MSNKKTGTKFEEEFCKLASEHGFWAHMLQGNRYGQPSDVIITKNGKSALIDCKVCESNKFLFSRIEENQELAMSKWIKTGNNYAEFALKISIGVRIIPFRLLCSLREAGNKQINYSQILEYSIPFEEWVVNFNGDNCQ